MSSINSPYNIFNRSIPTHPTTLDLSIIIANDLSFRAHISSAVSKARSRCAVYLKTFISGDKNIMSKFFITNVRPILEYGSAVWSPTAAANITKLENEQGFFTNKNTGCCYRTYKERLQLVSLHSLRHRRRVADIIFAPHYLRKNVCLIVLTFKFYTAKHNPRTLFKNFQTQFTPLPLQSKLFISNGFRLEFIFEFYFPGIPP